MKSLFICLFALMTLPLIAQTPKSIEITVIDTVELKTKSAELIFSMEKPYINDWENMEMEPYEDSEYYDEEYEDPEKKKRKNKKAKDEEAPIEMIEEQPILENEYYKSDLERLKNFYDKKSNLLAYLNKNGIVWDSVNIPLTEYDYSENEHFRLKITAKSWDEIKKTYNYCDTMENGELSVHTSTTESIEEHFQKIYEHLYAKAKKEAGIIAGITGLKLGGIIKVSNSESIFDPLFDLQNEMDKIINKTSELEKMELQKKLVRRTFVFEAK